MFRTGEHPDDRPNDLDAIARAQPPFPDHIGGRIVAASLNRVEGELIATPELGNRNGVLHGGAIMALAGNLAGTASFLNLKPGQVTTTVESKTKLLPRSLHRRCAAWRL